MQEKPLAICDWQTVRSGDWELCDQIHHDRLDEGMYLKYDKKNEWYWLPDQKDTELSLFVVWDSTKFEKNIQGVECTDSPTEHMLIGQKQAHPTRHSTSRTRKGSLEGKVLRSDRLYAQEFDLRMNFEER